MKTRIFIDFWNFQLNWNGRAPSGVRLDWTVVPPVFLAEAEKLLSKVGQGGSATLEETLVHASVNPSTEVGRNLRGWLTSFLDHQPSFNVRIRERKSRKFIVHCNSCDQEHSTCPACGADLRRAAEKGVDSAIVTDLLSLAVESAFDLAVLVSSDADLIPAVEWVQDR
ncbi:MAG: NYN domain-containing protein [Actinobacteria bacterium]|nr:NYN domain-containing protein [Actinomycetota bacterium]